MKAKRSSPSPRVTRSTNSYGQRAVWSSILVQRLPTVVSTAPASWTSDSLWPRVKVTSFASPGAAVNLSHTEHVTGRPRRSSHTG